MASGIKYSILNWKFNFELNIFLWIGFPKLNIAVDI